MKRHLPTISQGEIALAAISLPPLTDDANRHTPRPAHPGSAHAASNAAPIAASANRPGPGAGPITSPPSSTASAANAAPASAARDRNRRSAPPAGHLLDHRADSLGRIQPPGQHERREQGMTDPAQPAALPRHEHLPAPPRRPDIPPVTRPQPHPPGARRALQPREHHIAAGRHVGIDRQRAGPYDGHGR